MTEITNHCKVIHKTKPVILSLTNIVTAEFVANCLLAVGASPIMSFSGEEIDELMQIASALYINIGTLNQDFMALTDTAIKAARQYQKPIVLDPVGCGASRIRTTATKTILPHASIIRGNANEIIALINTKEQTKGVDAHQPTQDAQKSAMELVKQHDVTVVVSGKVDYIFNQKGVKQVIGGAEIMRSVTGMGCALTAIIAAFRSVSHDDFEAAYQATRLFCLSAERASSRHSEPGSFKAYFIDALYLLSKEST